MSSMASECRSCPKCLGGLGDCGLGQSQDRWSLPCSWDGQGLCLTASTRGRAQVPQGDPEHHRCHSRWPLLPGPQGASWALLARRKLLHCVQRLYGCGRGWPWDTARKEKTKPTPRQKTGTPARPQPVPGLGPGALSTCRAGRGREHRRKIQETRMPLLPHSRPSTHLPWDSGGLTTVPRVLWPSGACLTAPAWKHPALQCFPFTHQVPALGTAVLVFGHLGSTLSHLAPLENFT